MRSHGAGDLGARACQLVGGAAGGSQLGGEAAGVIELASGEPGAAQRVSGVAKCYEPGS